MAKLVGLLFLFLVGASYALPKGIKLPKPDDALQYEEEMIEMNLELYDDDGSGEGESEEDGPGFDPYRSNVYHLFTRQNPTLSQPLLMNNPALLQMTNFRNSRRTVVLLHGWQESVFANSNSVLIPAFLEAEDVNIIAVDWSVGASALLYRNAVANTIKSGKAVADFINWLNRASGSNAVQYHIVGHGYGGHQAGIVARNVDGDVTYVTGLDPANIGWIGHIEKFQPDDGLYTEVIHTNYGVYGYLGDLAQVDFYPNGGISMPGCSSNACDHDRSFFYFAESIVSGGFTGSRCLNSLAAVTGNCNLLPGRLNMGGLQPKFGSDGVYYLKTWRFPPFSKY